MTWRRYTTTRIDDAHAWHGGKPIVLTIESGLVLTGKQRVFHAYFLRTVDAHGDLLTVENSHCFVATLRLLDDELKRRGQKLDCIGTSRTFYQSGMLQGSRFGYIPDVPEALPIFTPSLRNHPTT